MATLDELKKDWNDERSGGPNHTFSRESLQKIFRSRVNKHLRAPFRYFWASFAMQILLYSLLSHVIVKNWGNQPVLLYSIACIALYIPFTIMLLKKFKEMARGAIEGADASSLHSYVEKK